VKQEPPGDGSRHGHRVNSFEPFDRPDSRPGSSPAAAVQAHRPAVFLHEDQGEHVPADSGHHGLDDVQDGGSGDRRVHCVPAVLEDSECGRGSQRLAGGHHASGGENGRARSRGGAFVHALGY